MKNIYELREIRNREQLAALERCFDLATRAQEVDVTMSPVAKEALGTGRYNVAVAAERESGATEEREHAWAQYEAAQLDYQAQSDKRHEELNQALTPKDVTTGIRLEAVKASPEELMYMVNLS